MKGHFCRTFVHGGSGWLMSRACVKKYLDLENYCMEKYKEHVSADDVNINHFIDQANISTNDIHTPTFVGWPVKTNFYDLLINSNFDYNVIKQPCNMRLQPCRVNEIVSWHNRQKIDYVNTIGTKIINEAPDFLWLHFYPHVGGEFCRFRKLLLLMFKLLFSMIYNQVKKSKVYSMTFLAMNIQRNLILYEVVL